MLDNVVKSCWCLYADDDSPVKRDLAFKLYCNLAIELAVK